MEVLAALLLAGDRMSLAEKRNAETKHAANWQ